jgi:hypothetical protein
LSKGHETSPKPEWAKSQHFKNTGLLTTFQKHPIVAQKPEIFEGHLDSK